MVEATNGLAELVRGLRADVQRMAAAEEATLAQTILDRETAKAEKAAELAQATQAREARRMIWMEALRHPAIQLLLMGAVTAVLNLLGTGWLVSQGYLGGAVPAQQQVVLPVREDEGVGERP